MNNGQAHSGPPFSVITAQGMTVLPRSAVVEMLAKNAAVHGKADLSLGPILREAADIFREWSKIAEPGWSCHAPEIGFLAIRLASNIQTATFLSTHAKQRLKEQAPQVETAPQEADRPRIFRS